MLENPWVVSIVGGIISSVIGGLILASSGRFSYVGGAEIAKLIVQIAFFFVLSAIFGALLFTLIPENGLSFGIDGLDPIIRIGFFIVGVGGIFLKQFYNIQIFRD